MQLSTGSTIWSSAIPTHLSRGPLSSDEQCDILVLGSGLTGALTAFHFAKAGANVVILDKRPISSGSTKVTTALIQYELDTPLIELSSQIGLANAQTIYRATRQALDDLRTLIAEADIDCDLIQRPTLYLARSDADAAKLKREAAARAEIGLEATFVAGPTLGERNRIRRPGAVRSEVSYELDPRKLAAGLLEASVALGTRVYDRTALLPGDGSPDVRTTDGHRISSDLVIYATGYETLEAWPDIAANCSLRTTYAAATAPLKESDLWPERALLWEMGDPYFYARTTRDNRVLLGGGDDETLDAAAREAALPRKGQQLIEQLAALTGIAATADVSWAGAFVRSNDGLPLIGSRPDAPRCYFNLGFGGNGIVFALLGAQILRDSLSSGPNPLAALFALSRPSLPDVANASQRTM